LSFFNELKRRNVVKVATAYAIVGWLLVEVTSTVLPIFDAPQWVVQTITFVIILGFPLALIFAWAFELTPEGLKKDKDLDRNRSITPVELQDSIKSIAVLAFENMSEDPDNEYFSDGISEEILNLLAKVPELRVTSRSSAFSFKGQNLDVPTMAARLKVAYVLEGSVRKSGNQLRITAQLIEAVTDTHLWSETYNFELENIFAIQDEIAESVVDALKIQLLGEAPRSGTTSPEAYALYLQSKALTAQFTAAGFLQAEAVVRRVLEIDSTYVPAWLQLALIYADGSSAGAWHPHEGNPKSHAAVMEALRLDADNAQAHVALSRIARDYDYDLETARNEQEIAVTLAPHDPGVLRSAARIALIDGDFVESIRLHKEREILDPVSWGPKLGLGRNYFRLGRLDEAKSAYAEAHELLPTGHGINYRLGTVMLVSGDLDDALLQMNKEPRDGYRLAGRAMVFHAMGDNGSAATELEKLIAIGDRWTYEIVQVHAYLGNLDESFSWLHRAIDRRDSTLSVMTGDPFLDNLRDDPRLDDVLERLGRKVH
jgi:adenylate cyclase